MLVRSRQPAKIHYDPKHSVYINHQHRLAFSTTVIDASSEISSALFAIVIQIPDNFPLKRSTTDKRRSH